MKIYKYIGFTMLVATALATASCSDWNDWNDTQTMADSNPSADKTLWENISSRSELQNFKTILEKVNRQDLFKSNKFYTIWAPMLTDTQRDSVLALKDSVIIDQFINNHIAEYNYQATGIQENRIHTLNDKAYAFIGSNNSYTFNNVKLTQANIPNSNGTMHILASNSPFLPNAYQYIWMAEDMDSIAKYFKRYELTELDPSQSVAGPIVNGHQTYIDSVMITYNSMTNSMRARLDNEDSTYTFIMPNNEAYEKMYKTIKSLYKYKESTLGQNVADAASSTYATVTGTSNVEYLNFLADSLTRRQIVNNLAYSHYNRYNKAYFEDGNLSLDTIFSTYRNKFSEPDRIFDEEHIVARQRLSNGEAVIVDSLGFKSWETYNTSNVTAGIMPCRVLNGTPQRKMLNLSQIDTEKIDLPEGTTTFSYIQVPATSNFVKPEVDYYLTDVKSGTYRIYVVIPPADIDVDDQTEAILPNWLSFSMNYFNGTRLTDYQFTNERFDPNNNVITTYNATTGAEVKTTIDNKDFFNDPERVDTLYLGEFTFPYCYVGLTDVYPNIKVTCSTKFSTLASRGHTAAFDKTIRIARIILRPVDYDDYLKEEEE